MTEIEKIEQRFLEITRLDVDLKNSNITEQDSKNQQQKTSKAKSKEFGQVFTPLFIVDKMVNLELENLTPESLTCDLCAGCGQFTIRIMRKIFANYPNMDVLKWLKDYHVITEIQPESCAKLIYIFGKNIILYAGDSMEMTKAMQEERGVLFFNKQTDKWENNKSFDKFLNSKYADDMPTLMGVFKRCLNHYDKLVPIKGKKKVK